MQFSFVEMRKRKVVPKLGSLQRWVRDCDAAGGSLLVFSDDRDPQLNHSPNASAVGSVSDTALSDDEIMVFRVLDSIIRTVAPRQIACCAADAEGTHVAMRNAAVCSFPALDYSLIVANFEMLKS